MKGASKNTIVRDICNKATSGYGCILPRPSASIAQHRPVVSLFAGISSLKGFVAGAFSRFCRLT